MDSTAAAGLVILIVLSFGWGGKLLWNYRRTHSREQLVLGLLFTLVIPGICYYLLARYLDTGPLTPPRFEEESGAISSCYMYGPITYSLRPSFWNYRRKLIALHRHRLGWLPPPTDPSETNLR